MVTGEQRINSAVRVLAARVERVIALAAVRAPRTARVEAQALATDLAAELEIVPVAVERALVRVVARELGTVRLEGVPEREPAVAPLRTKSVTAAHPHGLLRLLAAAEVSAAAVAEISLAPAATEAATAWVAEASAAVVAAAGEAAEAEAEEEDVVDEQIR